MVDIRSSELNSTRCQIRYYQEPIGVKRAGLRTEEINEVEVRGETRIAIKSVYFIAVSVVLLEQPEERIKKEGK